MATNTLSGVFSGIDSKVLIERIVGINTRSVALQQVRQDKLQSKSDALSQVRSMFVRLQDAAAQLRNVDTERKVLASVSDNSLATVSTTTKAIEGSYQVEINQLARGHRMILTAGLAGLDAIMEGSFAYTYNGVSRTVTGTADTTLSELVDLINQDSQNPGVTASLLQHNGSYHVVLSGKLTGADKSITIDPATTLAALGVDAWTTTQAAQDAKIRVDGFPAGEWITRSSNTISDVLPDMTLNLKNVTTDKPLLVTVSRDTATLKTALTNLVNIYNDVATQVSDQTGYDADAKKAGLLQGTTAVTSLLTQVRLDLSAKARGFSAGDPMSMLADVGVSFDSQGKLSLDEAKWSQAIASDYDAVLAVLGTVGSGSSTDSRVQFVESSDATSAGRYELNISYSLAGSITQVSIRGVGESVWRNATWEGSTIYGAAGGADEGLVLSAPWDGVSQSVTSTISVREGFAQRVYARVSEALDAETGSVTAAETTLETQIKTIADNIERQSQRLEKLKADLEAKFARLEATLAALDSQRGAFDALIGSLDSRDSKDKK